MSIEKTLQELDTQIKYLSNNFKVPGMAKEDIAQELRLVILQDYKKLEKENDMYKFKTGWWFKRLKWHVLNLLQKAKQEPVNRSVRIGHLKLG